MGTGANLMQVNLKDVSIQLMSPASGNVDITSVGGRFSLTVSIQLMSPASGNETREETKSLQNRMDLFPFN